MSAADLDRWREIAKKHAVPLESFIGADWRQNVWNDEGVIAMIAEAMAQERERCAQICDQYPQRDPAEDGNGYWAAENCAAAIRQTESQPKGD